MSLGWGLPGLAEEGNGIPVLLGGELVVWAQPALLVRLVSFWGDEAQAAPCFRGGLLLLRCSGSLREWGGAGVTKCIPPACH